MKEASNQARNTCSELKERWENEREKMASKISLRDTREQELTEMRTIVDELQTSLREEQLKIDRLEEELRQ